MDAWDDETRVQSAIRYIDPHDRDVWLKTGMAVKDALGDKGFGIWNEWSKGSSSYKPKDALIAWRSFRLGKGITIATLFYLARQGGWQPKQRDDFAQWKKDWDAARRKERGEEERKARMKLLENARKASEKAQSMLERCKYTFHPYLALKGFPERRGLVLEGNLIVPARNRKNKLMGLQSISEAGEKLFVPKGCKIGGACFKFGVPKPKIRWWCEGYVTALSVHSALRQIYRADDQVVVTFSSANLAGMARDGIVVADHDPWRCAEKGCKHEWSAEWHEVTECPTCSHKKLIAPAGEKAARSTGLIFWKPPERGDANDYHKKWGLTALAEHLRELVPQYYTRYRST